MYTLENPVGVYVNFGNQLPGLGIFVPCSRPLESGDNLPLDNPLPELVLAVWDQSGTTPKGKRYGQIVFVLPAPIPAWPSHRVAVPFRLNPDDEATKPLDWNSAGT